MNTKVKKTTRKLRESIKKQVAFSQEYKCKLCSNLLPSSYQVDHIIPHSVFIDDSEQNLQALCNICHSLKTQKEQYRIIKFQKLQKECPPDLDLCWFCLSTYEKNEDDREKHYKSCSTELKDIDKLLKKQDDIIISFDQLCEKYRYKKVDKIFDKYCKKEEKKEEKLSDILKIDICIDSCIIQVNNFHYKDNKEEMTIKNIGEAVMLATNSKKFSNLYTTVEVNIFAKDEDGKDECISYLEEELSKVIPERILKKGADIMYFYS